MTHVAPPRPPRRPPSAASHQLPSATSRHAEPAAESGALIKAPIPSRVPSARPRRLLRPSSASLHVASETDASGASSGGASEAETPDATTPTCSKSLPLPGHRAPGPGVSDPQAPPPADGVFVAASALMAAVTAGTGKNIIIGPCTCRTCSVGCLVELLAMITGRVEQLGAGVVADPDAPSPYAPVTSRELAASPAARLREASAQLRTLVSTLVHVQLRDSACRVPGTTGTQFVVALPHVQVDYLRPQHPQLRHNGGASRAAEAEAAAPHDVEVLKDGGGGDSEPEIPLTPPLRLHHRVSRGVDAIAQSPPQIHISPSDHDHDHDHERGPGSRNASPSYAWGARASPSLVRRASPRSGNSASAPGSVGSSRVSSPCGPISDDQCKDILNIVLESENIDSLGDIDSGLLAGVTTGLTRTPSPVSWSPSATVRSISPSHRPQRPLSPTSGASAATRLSERRPGPQEQQSLNGVPDLNQALALRRSITPERARRPGRTTTATSASVSASRTPTPDADRLRNDLSVATLEASRLRDTCLQLEATVAELRGRLAAAETMIDSYEDLAREVDAERRQLESEKLILEMENVRLEKRNALLQSARGRF